MRHSRYLVCMWGIVAFGFIAAIVVPIVQAINDPALVFHTIFEKLFHRG